MYSLHDMHCCLDDVSPHAAKQTIRACQTALIRSLGVIFAIIVCLPPYISLFPKQEKVDILDPTLLLIPSFVASKFGFVVSVFFV